MGVDVEGVLAGGKRPDGAGAVEEVEALGVGGAGHVGGAVERGGDAVAVALDVEQRQAVEPNLELPRHAGEMGGDLVEPGLREVEVETPLGVAELLTLGVVQRDVGGHDLVHGQLGGAVGHGDGRELVRARRLPEDAAGGAVLVAAGGVGARF